MKHKHETWWLPVNRRKRTMPHVNKTWAAAFLGMWISALAAAGCSREGNEPPEGKVPGQCGLAGTYVECISDKDCAGYYDSWCDDYGHCSGKIPFGNGSCYGMSYGDACNSPAGTFCDGNGRCEKPCRTHADCEYGMCVCMPGGMALCETSRCPCWGDESLYVPGTLLCHQPPSFLQADCWRGNMDSCPDGYKTVGDHFCELIDKDAGVPTDGGTGNLDAGTDAGADQPDAEVDASMPQDAGR